MELKVRLWKKCGIIVELTFRRINSTLWNFFGSFLSGVDGNYCGITVEVKYVPHCFRTMEFT